MSFLVTNSFCFKKVNCFLPFHFSGSIFREKNIFFFFLQLDKPKIQVTDNSNSWSVIWKLNYPIIIYLEDIMLQSLELWLKTENRITVSSSFCLYFASPTSGLRKGSPIPSWKALWGAKAKEPASIFLPAGILSAGFPACLLLLTQCLCWIRMTGPCTMNWW